MKFYDCNEGCHGLGRKAMGVNITAADVAFRMQEPIIEQEVEVEATALKASAASPAVPAPDAVTVVSTEQPQWKMKLKETLGVRLHTPHVLLLHPCLYDLWHTSCSCTLCSVCASNPRCHQAAGAPVLFFHVKLKWSACHGTRPSKSNLCSRVHNPRPKAHAKIGTFSVRIEKRRHHNHRLEVLGVDLATWPMVVSWGDGCTWGLLLGRG